VFGALILGLLCLIAPAAASALFSLAVAGNNLAWGTPIFARVVWGGAKFSPGAFYTGRFSKPIAWAAVTFLAFGITLCMFPVGGPDLTPEVMNYTVVINMALWGGCTIYYFVDAHKWFQGPRTTIEGINAEAGDLTDEQRRELVREGLVVDKGSGTDEVHRSKGG